MRRTTHIAFCVIFVVFSLVPTFYELSRRNTLHTNRSFELVHNYYTDYNFYLSRIRQGIEGRFTVLEKYTSEPHEGSFIQAFYLLSGWAGRMLRIPPGEAWYVYHASRTVLGATLLIVLAYYMTKTFTQWMWQLIGFFLVVTASSWPIWVLTDTGWKLKGHMIWWTVVDNLQRMTHVPHLLASQILVFVLLYLLSNRRVSARPRNGFFLGILGFILGMIFPPALMLVGVAVVFLLLFQYIFYARGKKEDALPIAHALATLGIFLAISVPSLVYFQLMFSLNPWKRLLDFFVMRPPVFHFLEYFKALGPTLPLGMLGLVVAIRKKEKIMIASLGWIGAWALLLYAFSLFPQTSPLRISQLAPHIPLGILTTYFFFTLYQWRPTNTSLSRSFGYLGIGTRAIAILAPFTMITAGLVLMYYSWEAQKDFIDHKIRATIPLVHSGTTVMYPLKSFVEALKFLEDSTTRETVVLSESTAGNYMPVYSGNTVYIGQDNTVNAEQKKELVQEFFRGRMPSGQAYEWLKYEGLSYVFFGPQEKEDGNIGDLSAVYSYLKEVFRNEHVIIYRVDGR